MALRRKNHPGDSPIVGFPALILLLTLSVTTQAVEFAGGTGDPNNPYQIATAEQLIAIGSDPNLADRHFVLVADIDLDPNLPGRRIFDQAVMKWHIAEYRGYRPSTLYGSFDGDGHVIRNCVLVTKEDTVYAGFFGVIAPQGVVRDLHLKDTIVTDLSGTRLSYSDPALLAAFNQGTVIGCSATGRLTTPSGGGLIGRNAGIVAGCRTCCDVVGDNVGGLIGFNGSTGRVVLCEFDGTLHADSRAGGIASYNEGTVQYCKAGGSVSASAAGGLVSGNGGVIRECCAAAAVTSGGGLVYENDGTIINCHATGTVSGTIVDGLVVSGYGRVVSSYSTTTSLPKYAPEVQYVYYLDLERPDGPIDSPFTRGTIALSQTQMTQKSSFMGFDFYGDVGDGPADHWFMPRNGFPVLTWQTEVTGLAGVPDVSGLSLEQARAILGLAGLEPNAVCYDYAGPRTIWPGSTDPKADTKNKVITARPARALPSGSPVVVVLSLGKYDYAQNSGDGSEERPYRIETAGQLDALCDRSDLSTGHFELATDIDLSGYFYPGSVIWYFNGELNGNGHAIRNLQCGRGLISRLGRDASVHDVVVRDAWVHNMPIDQKYAQVSSAWDIGVLICENWGGQVSRCDVTGQIFGGSSAVGGLVGSNQGPLTDCRFRGRIRPVDDSSRVGGLVGTNSGSILRCCARDVEVWGGDCVGGLAGWNNPVYGPIEACYATGTVQGINFVGGLVGQHGTPTSVESSRRRNFVTGGVICDCYAACSLTGWRNVGGCVGSAAVPETAQESCFFLDAIHGGSLDSGFGTPLTAEQMRQQASFEAWDFEKVWMICEGKDYPRLRWEGVECDAGD